MIVSHKHKFIFVHLKRSSGRAVQSALEPFLGPDDIATPVLMKSEDGTRDKVQGRNCEGVRRHWTALQIRDFVGEDVWNEYFTFTLERNPWDKTLSRYFGYIYKNETALGRTYKKLRGKPMPFEHWLQLRRIPGNVFGKKHYHLPSHFDCYTDENDKPMVDLIGRFENRNEHLEEIGRRIGIKIDPGVRVGTNSRASNKKDYTEMFHLPWMQQLMERVFAKDLAYLGYRFGQPHPTNLIEPALEEAIA